MVVVIEVIELPRVLLIAHCYAKSLGQSPHPTFFSYGREMNDRQRREGMTEYYGDGNLGCGHNCSSLLIKFS